MRVATESFACVVIHHDNLDCLPQTIRMLRAEGLDARDLIVVDNSGRTVTDGDLARAMPPESSLERVENKGYGHAANHGVASLLGRNDPPETIVIATHEVRPRPGALRTLLGALADDPGLMAVGPTMVSRVEGKDGWVSTGGTRSRVLGIPQHVRGDSEPGKPSGRSDRLWLDGAFVAYRSSVFRTERFREEFFLYYEETELHYRISETVGGIACIPAAIVEETANDVPPELQGRNLQWLLDLHGRWWQRLLTVPWIIARTGLKVAIGRATPGQFRSVVRGWREARRNPLSRVVG